MKRFKNNIKSETNDSYEKYLNKLLEIVKEKGILVETMKLEDSFLLKTKAHNEYKEFLGAVPVKDKSDNITNVYVVYEDYDGSIKYYDFSQYDVKKKNNSIKEKLKDILFDFMGLLCVSLFCSLSFLVLTCAGGYPANLQLFALVFILSFLLTAVLVVTA